MPPNVASSIASLRGALATTAAHADFVEGLLDEAQGALHHARHPTTADTSPMDEYANQRTRDALLLVDAIVPSRRVLDCLLHILAELEDGAPDEHAEEGRRVDQ